MYAALMFVHLATVLPCVVLGAFLLSRRKGTRSHRTLGKIYMVLMLLTATTTFFMPARVGPAWLGHFGFVHLFSVLTLATVPRAYVAARSGNVGRHRRSMIVLYVGAIVIAGAFTLAPGRYLHEVLFGGAA